MPCLTGPKFSMRADLLRQGEIQPEGTWEVVQDPESGGFNRVWVPSEDLDPNAVGRQTTFKCTATGVLSSGLQGAGSTEKWDDIYDNVDWAKMTVPKSVPISKRDRVTNIRDRKNNVIFKDEETPGQPATVFEVMGVTPITFRGSLIEQSVLLKRAEVA